MKKLMFCRHAKSSWDEPSLSDHDRPLAPRGLRDAPIMADRIKEKGYIPDLILTSSARRALQTATIFADALGISQAEIQETEELYHATTSEILETVRRLPDSKQIVFLFGHNPGLNDIIYLLGAKIGNFPTTGVYGFEFSAVHWNAIGPKNARTLLYDYPKKKP